MSSRIVFREEIQDQINMIGALSGDIPAGNVRSYKELHDSINTTLSSAQEAIGRRLGKNYTEQIRKLNNDTRYLHGTAMIAYDVLVKCRDTYQGMDQYLRTQADGIWDYSWCENPATQSVATYSVVEMYNNGEKIPTNTEFYPWKIRDEKNTFYFTEENGCTWYAYNRYREVTGKDLIFADHPGNASNWHNSIDKNCHNVLELRGSEEVQIVPKSVAVTCSRKQVTEHRWSSSNHVVYVEAVQDGNVYYSESSYRNTSIAGQIKCESIEEFKKEFDYLITEKKRQ